MNRRSGRVRRMRNVLVTTFCVALLLSCGALVTTETPPSPCAAVACGDGTECCPTQEGVACVAPGSCRTTGLTCTSAAMCPQGHHCCARPIVDAGASGAGGFRGDGGRRPGRDGGFRPPGDGGFGEGGFRPPGDGGFGRPPGDGGFAGRGDGGPSIDYESYCAATCADDAQDAAPGRGGSRTLQLCLADGECNDGTCTEDPAGLKVCRTGDGGP
jgi:hypothetical protein